MITGLMVHFMFSRYERATTALKYITSIFKELELFRDLPENLQEIVRPTLVRGSWHAHSYNILTHLLSRGSEEDREWAVRKTLDLR